ncbi:MAG: hypothetical protein GYA29_08640 [Methanothrix sp.]|nr:hypothetical protein [Methanothrix sp.]
MQVLQGTAFLRIYESMVEISELRRALKAKEHDGAIREYLERRGRRDGGRVVLEDDTVHIMISWRTDRSMPSHWDGAPNESRIEIIQDQAISRSQDSPSQNDDPL